MKIEQLYESWKKDAKIDDLNYDRESAEIPTLHAKYIELLSTERSKLRALHLEKRLFSNRLRDYYLGNLNNPEDLKEINREPYLQKIMKTEVQQYVDADTDIIKLDYKINIVQEKVEFLTEVVRSINNRSYTIKNAIEFLRLTGGPT